MFCVFDHHVRSIQFSFLMRNNFLSVLFDFIQTSNELILNIGNRRGHSVIYFLFFSCYHYWFVFFFNIDDLIASTTTFKKCLSNLNTSGKSRFTCNSKQKYELERSNGNTNWKTSVNSKLIDESHLRNTQVGHSFYFFLNGNETK